MQKRNIEKEAVQAIKKHPASTGKKIFPKRGMSSYRNANKFYRCDGNYPHNKPCPATQETCNKCGKIGHFARCCKTKTTISSTRVAQRGRNQPYRRGDHRALNELTAHLPSRSESDKEYLFAIQHNFEPNKVKVNSVLDKAEAVGSRSSVNFYTVVTMKNQKVKVLIDNGASVNIMNLGTFEGLNRKLTTPLDLQRTKTKVITFWTDKPNLIVMGVVNVFN